MIRRDFCKTIFAAAATSFSEPGGTRADAGGEFPDVPGLTKYVANFVGQTSYESIPQEVIELGKKSILDGFGLALAGSAAETGALSRKYIQSLATCGGKCTVIGSNEKFPPRFAALVNAISIHADDFDDTQLSAAKDRVYGLLVHPTVPVLPAVFALSEHKAASGKDLLLAYQVGVEVECKIAEAISPRHYQDGFHSTGTCGSLGAAAACSKLYGLDVKRTLDVFGIAASEAGGLGENFGTMTKPFQAGRAAENGIIAADLAVLGWTAAEQILEAKRGFFHAYGGSFEPSFIQSRLGKPWTFASPGISIKPFPSGSLTHPGMTEMLRLIEKNNIRATEVERVDVGTNHNLPDALIHHRPHTGLEAKFSMEFCLAILLLEGKAGLAQFTDRVVQRPDVREMIARVNFYVDPEAEKAGYDKMRTILRIRLKDGRILSGQADFAKGSPADPMSFDMVAGKFRQCAEYAGWPSERSAKIIDLIARLERVSDLAPLSALLAGEGKR